MPNQREIAKTLGITQAAVSLALRGDRSISADLRQKILPGFEEYGLTIPQFYVTHIVLPEDDPNFKRIRELHTVMLQTRTYQAEAAVKTCEEIDRLESDADRVMRSALSKLFREEPDVREVIKLKAIYELLETITDKCEDVANLIEGIVLENS